MLLNLRNRLRLEGGSFRSQVIDDLTVAIPVRNEKENLKFLLPELVDQIQRPKTLLFLDDGSSDGTAELIDDYAKRHPWIERRKGESLPAGWQGKVWALQQLLRFVNTEFVLFMDADVRLNRSITLASLWKTASSRDFGFLTVFPRARVGRGARVLVNQIHTHLYYFLPFNAEKLPQAGATAGCGQVMLARSEELRQLGAFGRLRASTHDGLRLARLYKQSGKRVLWVDGGVDFSCLTYRSFKDAFFGFSRNSFEGDQSLVTVVVLSSLFFWVFVLPYILWPFFLLNPLWMTAFLILIYGQIRMAQEFDLGASHVALMPVQAMASISVHLWGALRSKLQIGTLWHGRMVR